MGHVVEFLVQRNVNILFAECAASGHKHATWNILAEALDVRQQVMKKLNEARNGSRRGANGVAARTKLASFVGARMFEFANDLSNALVNEFGQKGGGAGRLNGTSLLYHRFDSGPDRLWTFKQEDVSTGAWDLRMEQQTRQVRISVTRNLMYFWLYGTNVGDPLRSTYYSTSSKLQCDHNLDAENAFSNFKAPTAAIVSLDTAENYARFIVFDRETVRNQMILMELHHEGSYRSAVAAGEVPSSKGLLSRICFTIAGFGVNLLRVSNLTTHLARDSDAGSIRLVGMVPVGADDSTLRLMRGDLERIVVGPDKSIQIKRVKVDRYPIRNLFLSTHFNATAFPSLRQLVEGAATAEGFANVVIADTNLKSATENVIRKVSECHAMLQIMAMKNDTDLSWLLFEYGLARGTAMPCIRMVDLCNPGFKLRWWTTRLRIDQDTYLIPFDSRNPEAMKTIIEEAIRTLMSELE